MIKPKFKGISFKRYTYNKSIQLTDMLLVKQDILNHFFTRRGERVKMPTFGTRIPDMVFEPLDETSLNIIEQDFNAVINYDPRVEVIEARVVPLYDKQIVVCIADLNYIDFNINDVLHINLQFEE